MNRSKAGKRSLYRFNPDYLVIDRLGILLKLSLSRGLLEFFLAFKNGSGVKDPRFFPEFGTQFHVIQFGTVFKDVDVFSEPDKWGEGELCPEGIQVGSLGEGDLDPVVGDIFGCFGNGAVFVVDDLFSPRRALYLLVGKMSFFLFVGVGFALGKQGDEKDQQA